MKSYEQATVQFRLDGTAVAPVPAKLRFEYGRWIASAALPRASTPGKTVPLLGKGITRDEAIQRLIDLANYRLAYDQESQRIERQRVAAAAPARSPWLSTTGGRSGPS
jgi:hypothetical protein